MVDGTASRDATDKTHLSLVNMDPNVAVNVSCELRGMTAKPVTGRLLTAPDMTSHNTFDAPNTVAPKPFTGATLSAGKLAILIPPKSVVTLELP